MLSDGGFAKRMGLGVEEYVEFSRAYRERLQQNASALSVPWLPEGMDLAGLVFGGDSPAEAGRNT